MQCGKCRAEIPDDSVFCHNCGAKIEQQPERPPTAAPRGPDVGAGTATRAAPAVPTPAAPRSRYTGVSLVSGTLWVLGWLIAIVGLIGAFAVASQDEFNGEEIDGAMRIGLFLGTLILSWLVAVSVLWSAYVLRLLSDIEGRLRGGGK